MSTAPSTITSEIQKLEPSAIIELFELDASSFGAGITRFHAGTNGLRQNIVWAGNTYTAYPVQASGFEWSGQGSLPRPRLTVANVTGAISLLVIQYDDLLGAKVTRRRTLAKYLDRANFPDATTFTTASLDLDFTTQTYQVFDANPTSDATAAFADDVYYIDRKTLETRDTVEFELSAAFDVAGVQLPRRQIIQNVCPWVYRGAECSYTGGSYFDANDAAVGSLGLDVCGKRLTSCKARFGSYGELPFGSFPSAGLIK